MKIVLTRLLTFFASLLLILFIAIELSTSSILISVIYLLSGHKINMFFFTSKLIDFFEKSKYVDVL